MSLLYQRQPIRDGEFLIASDYVDRFQPEWFDVAGDRDSLDGGRGSVGIVRTPIGDLVRRDYLRGGLPRHLVRDRYLWTGAERTRSFREFVLTHALHRAGLPVPEPVAARYLRRWFGYRAALLTRLVPNARTLLRALPDAEHPEILLGRVAEAVAQLHVQHVWHADLNATNVLVDAGGRIWLIDFDRAELGASEPGRLAGNLERLLRSLRKRLKPREMAVVDALWPDFIARYRRSLSALSSASQ